MVRIAGTDIPSERKVDIALTRIYGIGRQNVEKILKSSSLDRNKRVHDLSEEEIRRIQKVIEVYKVEGDLRREIAENIKRLKEVGSYKGMRHVRNLPVRGQRTKSNARTKRGKRVTIGAIKKEAERRTPEKIESGKNSTK